MRFYAFAFGCGDMILTERSGKDYVIPFTEGEPSPLRDGWYEFEQLNNAIKAVHGVALRAYVHRPTWGEGYAIFVTDGIIVMTDDVVGGLPMSLSWAHRETVLEGPDGDLAEGVFRAEDLRSRREQADWEKRQLQYLREDEERLLHKERERAKRASMGAQSFGEFVNRRRGASYGEKW